MTFEIEMSGEGLEGVTCTVDMTGPEPKVKFRNVRNLQTIKVLLATAGPVVATEARPQEAPSSPAAAPPVPPSRPAPVVNTASSNTPAAVSAPPAATPKPAPQTRGDAFVPPQPRIHTSVGQPLYGPRDAPPTPPPDDPRPMVSWTVQPLIPGKEPLPLSELPAQPAAPPPPPPPPAAAVADPHDMAIFSTFTMPQEFLEEVVRRGADQFDQALPQVLAMRDTYNYPVLNKIKNLEERITVSAIAMGLPGA